MVLHFSGNGSFLTLSDSPDDYTGQAGKYIRVNVTEDGIEFTTVSGSGIVFLTNPRSLKEGLYYYFGGEEASGDWKINRYLISDVNTYVSATESVNSSYLTLDTAWAARATLTYS